MFSKHKFTSLPFYGIQNANIASISYLLMFFGLQYYNADIFCHSGESSKSQMSFLLILQQRHKERGKLIL